MDTHVTLSLIADPSFNCPPRCNSEALNFFLMHLTFHCCLSVVRWAFLLNITARDRSSHTGSSHTGASPTSRTQSNGRAPRRFEATRSPAKATVLSVSACVAVWYALTAMYSVYNASVVQVSGVGWGAWRFSDVVECLWMEVGGCYHWPLIA